VDDNFPTLLVARMVNMRLFHILRSLGLEFWLPLPLLGVAFWVGGGFLMDRVLLTHSYQTTAYLRLERPIPKNPKIVIVAITARINNHYGVSRVKVKTTSKALKELEFEFPHTEISQVETAISQELGLNVKDVRKLMRYQKDD
jgi:hypothetical protein